MKEPGVGSNVRTILVLSLSSFIGFWPSSAQQSLTASPNQGFPKCVCVWTEHAFQLLWDGAPLSHLALWLSPCPAESKYKLCNGRYWGLRQNSALHRLGTRMGFPFSQPKGSMDTLRASWESFTGRALSPARVPSLLVPPRRAASLPGWCCLQTERECRKTCVYAERWWRISRCRCEKMN